MYNKTQLKKRGWTPALIRDLLDPPDRTLIRRYPNPTRDREAPTFLEGPEHLYLKTRVLDAERRPEFVRGAHFYEDRRAHGTDAETAADEAPVVPRRSARGGTGI